MFLGANNGRTTIPEKAIWLVFLSFFLNFGSFAQNKGELEKKKSQLKKDIEYTNRLLSQTKKNKSVSMSQLVTLNKKITYRSELITTINKEIDLVENDLGYVSTNIDSLNMRLSGLKLEYGKMLYFAYRNQTSFSRLMFIFSADDFNQAFKRMQYLRTLSDYRQRQYNRITEVQDSLNGKKRQLQVVKQSKKHLLNSQQSEKKELDKEKKDQVTMLNNLTSREKKLRADLQEKQRQEQLLATKIEAIIKKEIEAARAAAKRRSANSTTASASPRKIESSSSSASYLSSTPEALKLSNDFESNRGQLPWPVEQGIVSSSFGRHAHPIWKEVVVNNNGIDINAGKGARARAIFEGKVISVFYVVDKYAVLIQHGEYFTLYSNLEEVFVKKGDKVITKQPIGIVQTNTDDGRTEVHLEIWRGNNKMNPENWIASRH